MYQTILVPLDGSKLAEVALRHVEQLAYELGSSLLLLRVVRPPHSVEHPRAEEMMALNREREAVFKQDAETYLAARRGELREKGLEVNTYVIVNRNVASTILDFAKRQDVDLIAMSTHGRSGVSRWVYGSVTDKVLQGSTRPVLLIRVTGHNE
jgi:nucleotide-binding universal stress UspA family protein